MRCAKFCGAKVEFNDTQFIDGTVKFDHAEITGGTITFH